MKNALEGLKVRPKRRAKGSPRTGETSADLLRSVPTSFPSGAPIQQPGWGDIESYDPQTLSYAAGRGITNALEGTKQLLGGARDYLGGFMQSVRERSPAELQGTAPARSKETYESVNRAVSQAAQDPLTTARNLASAFVDVGAEATKSPASTTEFIADILTPIPGPSVRRGPPVSQVVKQKGGDFPQQLEAIERLKTWEPAVEVGSTKLPRESVLNNWLETKLGKYIRNEMATPEDPIRKLAEEGILHVDPEQINYDLAAYDRQPILYGDSRPVVPHLAKSNTAKIWEGAADNQMGIDRARFIIDYAKETGSPSYARLLRENPWISDVAAKDPDRRIYIPAQDLGRDLGFDHLRDELFNSISPDSGLPRQLQLTNEQLGRMSVPDAVRHVSKINKWREKQKAEANFSLANNAATVPFKDYPDQKYGWFQLKADTPEGKKTLEDALKYEGDMMGHCVGGYCNEVFFGFSEIYSLRDKKTGAPHVTIEVTPTMTPNEFYYSATVPQSLLDKLSEAEQSSMPFDWEELVRNSPEYKAVPRNIKQIKGKGNLKPKADYIPFVQDFVRSQQWGKVQDLSNANLVDLNSSQIRDQWVKSKMADHVARQVVEDMQNEGVRFATLEDLNARHSAMVKERVAARKAAEPPEQKAARQQLRELRRAERRRERGE
jgi:hypothetical protein